MNEHHIEFEPLLSDAVLLDSALASDVATLWRRLSRNLDVKAVSAGLCSDPARIRALCGFVNALLAKPYEVSFRHPDDVAICAALVVLSASPLPDVRRLFARLRREERPSLVWVRRMALFCDDLFIDSSSSRYTAFQTPEEVRQLLEFSHEETWQMSEDAPIVCVA